MWILIVVIILTIIGGIVLFNLINNENSNSRLDILKRNLSSIDGYSPEIIALGHDYYYLVGVDEEKEMVFYVTENYIERFGFDDIIGVEIIEDGKTISHKSLSRTVGGAIIGGFIAGTAGAVIGGLSGKTKSSMQISIICVKILLRSLDMPSIEITCLDSNKMSTEHKSSINTDDVLYEICRDNAEDIKDSICVIIDRVKNKDRNSLIRDSSKSTNTWADDLLKLNELKQSGVISNEEYLNYKDKIFKTKSGS